MTRIDRFTLFVAASAAVVLLALFLLTFSRAAACNCPPAEPPTMPQPVATLQPGGGYVWIAWVGK